MPYNNHFAAQRRGILSLGLVLGRSGWVEEALGGPRGFGELLAGATRDDGLCYESSTLYHYATLGSLVRMAEVVRHQGHLGRDLYRESFANGRCLKQMFDAPLGLMLPNGELPPLGDCYAGRRPLWEMRADLYEIGFGVYGDPRHAWLLRRAGDRTSTAAILRGAGRLEPAEPPLGRSRIWPEHGYALLTSRTGAGYWDGQGYTAVLTGDRSGVHHHRDTLGLQVAAGGRLWTEDVECEAVESHGFSSWIQSGFNRTELAHNLVVVDEAEQSRLDLPLRVLEFKELPGCRTATLADLDGRLTPAVRRLRSVAVGPDYVLDAFQVEAETERTLDWLLHPRADGPAEHDLDFVPAALPERRPYSVLEEVASAPVGAGGAALTWRQTDQRFRAHVSAGMAAELIRATWPIRSDGSGGRREMFMLRVRAARVHFITLYQLGLETEPWRVDEVQRIHNGAEHELRVTVTRGDEARRHMFVSP